MATVKKRVRVTRKPKSCPNPLFEKWLQEMKDEAVRKESRTQYIYGKALKSLQKYPLRLHSGKECKVLQHFGNTLCDFLDKKLEKYLADGGILEPGSDHEDSGSPPPKVPKRSGSQTNPTRSREYIPARRSGAYGLLLALYKHADSAGYLSKGKLQDAAQPYADVSFTQKNVVDARYYSAWSSMSTLIKKGLVEKAGNPARYSLTEEGQVLAARLDTAEHELGGTDWSSSSARPVPLDGPSIVHQPKAAGKPPTVTKPSSPEHRRGARETHPTINSPQALLRPEDIILIDDDDEFGLCPMSTRPLSGAIGTRWADSPSADWNRDANSSPSPPSAPASKKSPVQVVLPPSSAPKGPPAGSTKVHPTVDDVICIDEDEFDRYPLSEPVLFEKPATPPSPSDEESQSEEEADQNEQVSTRPHDNITLRPGEYDIILCVDVAEVSGSGKNQKESASKAFQNCGVAVDVRKLAVGDFLWVCKPKTGSGIQPERELILPFVVERKRLDDLVMSIKDGRFKEQKFRLKNSGLPRPLYLVEEFGNRQNLGLPEASVMQAVANTLMIERFQVHWTKSSNESVAFLVEMTKQFIQLYRDKTVTSRSYLDNPGSYWQTRLVSFREYYSKSNKQKPLSVTQMFAKQLIQLRGLSVDKAEGIIKMYPTPSSLMDALKAAGPSAHHLLANIEYGKSGKAKRKIGLSLSTTIAMLYTQNRFES